MYCGAWRAAALLRAPCLTTQGVKTKLPMLLLLAATHPMLWLVLLQLLQ
jgi:hypothetical protein